MSPPEREYAAECRPARDRSVVSAENWSPDFRRLILAAALKGDLLDKLPMDPALFGSDRERGPQSSAQRIAAALVDYHAKYGTRPSPEAFTQLVAEVGAALGPEVRAVLESTAAEVLATDAPADTAHIIDTVREQLERRAIERGLVQAVTLLDRGGTAAQVREAFARASTPSNGAAGSLSLVRGSDITMRNVPWTWPQRIPRGALTLVVGDPDVNKTTICLDYAARVSRGKPFPDGAPGSGKPEAIIFLSAEDSPAYTLLPRFVALGGDPALIFFLTLAPGQPTFSLETDIAQLATALKQTGARHIAIDPVNAYLPTVNSWNDTDIRSALAPLAALAEQTDVTVLGIMHLNKKSDYSALQRVMGSTGYVAMARAVYLVAKDPENPGRRLFLNSKMNVAAKPTGLAFTLAPTSLPNPAGGTPIITLAIAWETSAVTVTADEVLRGATKQPGPREQAAQLITELLKDGPVPATEMERELEAAGFAERTVKRAKEKAGALSIKAPGLNGKSYWTPPDFTTTQRAAWLAERKAAQAGEECQ